MAYTPGPYIKETIEGRTRIRQDKEFSFFIAVMNKNTGNDEGNADLFVAAPDLLEACQLVLDECQDVLYSARLQEVTRIIKEAVKKARGETV